MAAVTITWEHHQRIVAKINKEHYEELKKLKHEFDAERKGLLIHQSKLLFKDRKRQREEAQRVQAEGWIIQKNLRKIHKAEVERVQIENRRKQFRLVRLTHALIDSDKKLKAFQQQIVAKEGQLNEANGLIATLENCQMLLAKEFDSIGGDNGEPLSKKAKVEDFDETVSHSPSQGSVQLVGQEMLPADGLLLTSNEYDDHLDKQNELFQAKERKIAIQEKEILFKFRNSTWLGFVDFVMKSLGKGRPLLELVCLGGCESQVKKIKSSGGSSQKKGYYGRKKSFEEKTKVSSADEMVELFSDWCQTCYKEKQNESWVLSEIHKFCSK